MILESYLLKWRGLDSIGCFNEAIYVGLPNFLDARPNRKQSGDRNRQRQFRLRFVFMNG